MQKRAARSAISALRPLAAGRAPDQRHLVRGGPLLRAVWAGAVTGALAVVEQVASVDVLLHPEELVLGVGQPDAQRHAAVGQGDILLHLDLPGARLATLIIFEDVEKGGGGRVHGGHRHVVH